MELWYDIFGRYVVVRSANRGLIAFIRGMESAWNRLACRNPGRAADVEVEIVEHPAPGPVRVVQDFSNASFFMHASRHRLITGHGARPPLRVHVQSYGGEIPRIAHAMVAPAMLNVIERCGLSTLHAAVVADRGRGVVIAGDTGRGKSTTALVLASQGFDFLTDNDAYLESSRGGILVRARGGTIGVRESATRVVRTLPALTRFPFSGEGRHHKRRVVPGRLGIALLEQAPARLLLFPSVGRGSGCRLVPMSPGRALEKLLASYPLGGSLRAVMKDVWAQGQRFDRLSSLVARAPAFELRLGPDVAGLGDLVRARLE